MYTRCCVDEMYTTHCVCYDLRSACVTGKRISQKLLRNCTKFLSIIHDVLKIAPMEYIKQSSDEIDIRGPESKYDSRKINSYPSKEGVVCIRVSKLFSGLALVSCVSHVACE